MDDCAGSYSLNDCHPGGFESGDDWLADWPGVSLQDLPNYAPAIDPMTCPDKCTTFPLGTKEKAAARTELNNFVALRDSCQSVKNYARAKLNAGAIRAYEVAQDPKNLGDFHVVRNKQIHIRIDMFGNPHELGMTLIHEGYHGYYNDVRDDLAEPFAQSCVTN